MSFEKHVFAGKGTFEVTIPFDFKKADDVSVFFVISTGGVFDGTLGQLLETGEVVSLTGRTYRFLGSEGVEIHGVVGCESTVTVDARLLLRSVEELRSELKSVLRFPDKWVRKIHAYPAKKRMGKAIVFDADGQPTVGLIPGTEVLYELVETARKAADTATMAKGEIEKLALSAESSSKTAFELLQNMQQLSKKVIADSDAALSAAKAEIVRIVSNAERDTADAQRAALEKISSAVSAAERQCAILRDNFSDALAAGLKSIDVKISSACAAILAEISEYRYKVVTREEYEALKEAGTLEDEVIYFVRGTVDTGKLVLE
ncbi:MAG: hypothetical protein IJY80_04375, partial [Opitutales bacterium]|nr:hypothetical protein [Opitutales bacterium]